MSSDSRDDEVEAVRSELRHHDWSSRFREDFYSGARTVDTRVVSRMLSALAIVLHGESVEHVAVLGQEPEARVVVVTTGLIAEVRIADTSDETVTPAVRAIARGRIATLEVAADVRAPDENGRSDWRSDDPDDAPGVWSGRVQLTATYDGWRDALVLDGVETGEGALKRHRVRDVAVALAEDLRRFAPRPTS